MEDQEHLLRSLATYSVERILSVPVSLLRDSKYSIWNTLFGILYLEYSIWITCYLEYSHTLLVSPCFTGFTHYLYTMDLPVYLEESITSQSTTKHSTYSLDEKRSSEWNGSTNLGPFKFRTGPCRIPGSCESPLMSTSMQEAEMGQYLGEIVDYIDISVRQLRR
jgi:hypothetical protein